jgi:pseudaminic acid cytidylyltransferase
MINFSFNTKFDYVAIPLIYENSLNKRISTIGVEMNSKIYCIIPARGGSKRIPRKNIMDFNGKPMIAYPIDAAKQSRTFETIMVSTEDLEIAEISRKLGAIVPNLRNPELALDTTSTIAVIQDAIGILGLSDSPDAVVMCLYPTSVLIDPQDLIDGIEIFEKNNRSQFLITLTEYSHPIERAYKRTGTSFSPLNPEMMFVRTQELETKWYDAGQFYISTVDQWMLPSGPSFPYIAKVFPSHKVTDIDTLEDLKRAETIFKSKVTIEKESPTH